MVILSRLNEDNVSCLNRGEGAIHFNVPATLKDNEEFLVGFSMGTMMVVGDSARWV
jgi:hypothetical protein